MSHSVISLISDLGTLDASLAIAKAVLMRHAPGVPIIDISHNVTHYDARQAACLLHTAYRNFAIGSIHIPLINALAANTPRMLLASQDGYYFITPDNGILSMIFPGGLSDTRLCFEFPGPTRFIDWLEKAGAVIESIRTNTVDHFTPYAIKDLPQPQPQLTRSGIECSIRYIDRYGNVTLEITQEQFEAFAGGRPFTIQIIGMQDIQVLSCNYSDVSKGQPLCRFNSAGFLEIALNHAPAASLLGIGSQNSGSLHYQAIRIFF